MSGKTNCKNHRIDFQSNSKEYHLSTGDGTKRQYRLHTSEGSKQYFRLYETLLPNGHRVQYEYEQNSRVSRISTLSNTLRPYASATYRYNPDSSGYTVELSDGRKIQ
jgi:hypothetical protein